ncbi:hypothetical protein [Neobacillus mesonae]|uniref:hypothetical protein n=1 Tax=Neobacillus mesonae TaxID=1193713 RepID=UPI0025744CDB|nr:hypothetical protein [Neobacillus mesonae]
MDKNSVKVTMTLDVLEKLVYQAATKACSNLYNGLVKQYLDRHDKDLETIISELDYLKASIRRNEEE